MRFCTSHWERLQAAIDTRGLGALVAENGEQAARNLQSEMTEGPSIDNFDPLMGAHNAIVNMAMKTISEQYSQNTRMLFADPNEHPEWACPVCALAWCHDEHNRLCTQEGCNWPREFDWASTLIDGAADHMLKVWAAMNEAN